MTPAVVPPAPAVVPPATAAGLALAAFRHLPLEGESFVEQGWRFEVVDLDGRRIDKLLVSAV